MKGGLNKIMRNITATAAAKTDFEKVTLMRLIRYVETD